MFFCTDTKIFGNLQIKQNLISIYNRQFIIMLVNAHFKLRTWLVFVKSLYLQILSSGFFFAVYDLSTSGKCGSNYVVPSIRVGNLRIVSFSMKPSIWILLCWSIVNFPQLFTSVKQGNSADLIFKVNLINS